MKKKIIWFALSIALAGVALTGCKNNQTEESTAPTETVAVEPDLTLVYAEVNTLDSIAGQTATAFKEKVEELSEGTIVIDIQAGGILGAENAVIDDMTAEEGTIDIAGISASALKENGVEKSALLSVPYTFESREHFWKFAESELASEFLMEPHDHGLGIRGLFYGEEGFSHFFTTKEITSLEEMQGIKMRAANDRVVIGMVNALGAKATVSPLAELYTVIKNGIVDGAEMSLANYQSNKLQEVAPNVILDGHTLSVIQVIMTDKAWDQLTVEQQNIITEASQYASEFNRRISAEAENKALEELKAEGITIVEDPDTTPWQEACKEVIESATKDYQELYQQILDMGTE